MTIEEDKIRELTEKTIIKDIGDLDKLTSKLEAYDNINLSLLKNIFFRHPENYILPFMAIAFTLIKLSYTESVCTARSTYRSTTSTAPVILQVFENFKFTRKRIVDGPDINYDERQKGFKRFFNKEAHKHMIPEYFMLALFLSISIVTEVIASKYGDNKTVSLIDENINNWAYLSAIFITCLFNLGHKEANLRPKAIQTRINSIIKRKEENKFTNQEEYTTHIQRTIDNITSKQNTEQPESHVDRLRKEESNTNLGENSSHISLQVIP